MLPGLSSLTFKVMAIRWLAFHAKVSGFVENCKKTLQLSAVDDLVPQPEVSEYQPQ